jgi:membrane protein DedA with SNARE-associated domain
MGNEDEILRWFSQYTYEPFWVYGAIMFLMFISSFGFPVPEEVTIVSAGLVCYMATRPDLFPPPADAGTAVNIYVAAFVSFFAVIISDSLVFYLGRRYGTKFIRAKKFKKFRAKVYKITRWTRKHGVWAAGVFRFTPGFRFPGHFACGMLGLSPIKFVTVDGLAALVTVPTQVLLIGFFGETILAYFKQVKIVVLGALVISLLWFLYKKFSLGPRPGVTIKSPPKETSV